MKASRSSSIRRLGALRSHGLHGARENTSRARAAFLARFEAEADPGHELPEDERRQRGAFLMRAYFVRLALKRHSRRSAGKTNAARSVGGVQEVGDDGTGPSTTS